MPDREAEAIAESIVPYFPDDSKKSRYLAFRATGFTFREAAQLAGISEKSVHNWRNSDPEFCQLDLAGISDLKKKLGAEYLNIQFTRNMSLVLQKDFNVLRKSVLMPDTLTEQEHQYLLKLRQFYTPQQLAIIQQMVGEITGDQLDFTKVVFQIRAEREELTIRSG